MINYIECPNCGERIPDYSMFCEMCGCQLNNNYQPQTNYNDAYETQNYAWDNTQGYYPEQDNGMQYNYNASDNICTNCGGSIINGICSSCGAQYYSYDYYQQNMQYNDGQQYDNGEVYDSDQQYGEVQQYNNEMGYYQYNQENKPVDNMLQSEQTEDFMSLDDMPQQSEQPEDYKSLDDMPQQPEQTEAYKPLDDMLQSEQTEAYKPLEDIVEQKEQAFESIIDEKNTESQAAPLNFIEEDTYDEVAAARESARAFKEVIDFSDSALATGLPEWTIEAPMIVVRKKGKN